MATLREQLEAARANPNAQTMLDFIAHVEGVKHGYNTQFGNRRFDSLEDHPRQLFPFTTTKGKKQQTSAAGRYQFTQDTWDDIRKKIKADDFGEVNQDLGALYLLRRAGALDDVLRGDFEAAIPKIGGTWAGASSSKYDQPKRSAESERAWFAARTGGRTNPVAEVIQQAVTPVVPRPVQSAVAEAAQAVASAQRRNLPGNVNNPRVRQTLPGDVNDPVAALDDDQQAALEAELALLAQQRMAPAIAQVAEEVGGARARNRVEQEDAPDWEREIITAALDAEADAIRHNAVNQLFGDPAISRVRLPQGIEEAIDRALRSL